MISQVVYDSVPAQDLRRIRRRSTSLWACSHARPSYHRKSGRASTHRTASSSHIVPRPARSHCYCRLVSRNDHRQRHALQMVPVTPARTEFKRARNKKGIALSYLHIHALHRVTARAQDGQIQCKRLRVQAQQRGSTSRGSLACTGCGCILRKGTAAVPGTKYLVPGTFYFWN